MENILRAPQILLPGARFSLEKWAVVACDQFTSQPEYWQETQALAQGAPSALNIVYPEAWLAQGDARIAEINRTMEEYLHGVLTRQVDGYVLVERETSTANAWGWWRKSTWRPTITGPAARRASAPRRARSWSASLRA